MIPLGMFICVGGTYGVVVQIKEAYASGRIGELRYLQYSSGERHVNILLTTLRRALRSLSRITQGRRLPSGSCC